MAGYEEPLRGRGRLSLITCDSGRPFAESVRDHLAEIIGPENGNAFLRKSQEVQFSNGEIKTVIEENIRGDDVYVIQCLDDPYSERSVNDNLMALVTAVHAAQQSDADSITVVVPQYPYSRQERKKTREAITARVVSRLLEDSGANRIITLDIHSEAIMGFFQHCTLEDLHASAVILEHFRDNYPIENLVVASPDVGGADMARYYANHLGCPLAIIHKQRDYSRASVIESMALVGDVRGKDVLVPDDMIATGGTLMTACKLLKDEGAERIFLACALPFLNGNAVPMFHERFEEGYFNGVIGTDAVHRDEAFLRDNPWYGQVSVAPLFARVIFNINQKLSVSQLLK